MKKYILFKINDYYPGGGIKDIHDSFDTLEMAKITEKEIMKNEQYSSSYIVDRDSWEKIL